MTMNCVHWEGIRGVLSTVDAACLMTFSEWLSSSLNCVETSDKEKPNADLLLSTRGSEIDLASHVIFTVNVLLSFPQRNPTGHGGALAPL